MVGRKHRKLASRLRPCCTCHSPTIQALFCLLPLVITASPASQVYSTTTTCHSTSVNYY
ncbi:hypothetical protein FIBSPDRAFT_1055746, partial [Athelia psychrophila]